jgi:predicted ATPase
VAYDLSLFDKALDEPVMRESLLRSGSESRPFGQRLRASEARVRGRLNRLARGDARLTPFSFTYTFPAIGEAPAPVLSFEVEPDSQPPTNIHVLIGRNGVGKTRCLQNMAQSLATKPDGDKLGSFASRSSDSEARGLFSNLVSITFSAFDPFGPIVAESGDARFTLNYSYVGLRKPAGASKEVSRSSTKDSGELTQEFIESAEHCRTGFRRDRWLRALETLSSDPLFSEANVSALASNEEEAAFAQNAKRLYERLSSGHKIVLLMITRLVELVEERTLVLLDEPEAHLHPPLLAAFVRALSDLLVQRNGVAIVATHSPVVLQEVPKACVNILHRVGLTPRSERPGIETFGENVGVLTREVFGLEVTQSGYHRLLQDAAADKRASYEDVLRRFKDHLGAEARAIVAALVAVRDSGDETDSES